MSGIIREDLALLALRIGVAWVFLYAAWRNTNRPAAWQWTQGETSLLFRGAPEPLRGRLTTSAAVIGMVMMYFGGVSALLGLEPRLGGVAIALFSLMGMRIHAIRRDEALQATGASTDPTMAWSAYGAHTAAGLKNWALIAAGLVLILVGGGDWVLADFAGGLIFPEH